MISKVTSRHKYLGDPSKLVARKEIYDLHANAHDKSWCNPIILTGGVDPLGEYNHVFPWWDPITNCIIGNWYTTEPDAMLNLYNNTVTPDLIEEYRKQGWDISIPLELEHNFPLVWKKDKMLEMYNTVSNAECINGVKTISTSEGTYLLKDDVYELWASDGTVGQMLNSSQNFWLWNYMMHKQSFISVRCRKMTWCEELDHNHFNFYHEMCGPNNELGVAFTEDLKDGNIELNDQYVSEFIDYIHLTVPYAKRQRPDYSRWPTTPITFENRRRDSLGYYLMYFTGWEKHDWKSMQLEYLDNFLSTTSEFAGNKGRLMDYADSKWDTN